MSAPDAADDFAWLPGVLAEIAQVAGIDAAIALAKVKGGARCTFPVRAKDDHWLVSVVGREKANALCRHFTTKLGIELLIPKGVDALRKRHYHELRAEGVSVETAARKCGAHVRSARRWEHDKAGKAAGRARVKRRGLDQLDMLDWLDGLARPRAAV